MEKILTDFVDSIKYYFRVLHLFIKNEYGIDKLLFIENPENTRGKKYLVLLFSFLVFYLIGIIPGRDFDSNLSGIHTSYGALLDNIESERTFKEHFSFLFSLILFLEVIPFIISKKQNRPYVSNHLFLLVSFWFVFIALIIGITFIVMQFFLWLGMSTLTWQITATILCLLLSLILLYKGFARLVAYVNAEKRGQVSDWFLVQVIISNILAPVGLIFLLSGILTPSTSKNQIYFLNGNKNIANILYEQIGDKYLLKTSLIAINKSTENYIYDPKGKSFYLYFTVTDENDSIIQKRGDTVLLINKDTSNINIAPNIPIKLELSSIVSKNLFCKIKYIQDSLKSPIVNMRLRTLDKNDVYLGFFPLNLKKNTNVINLKISNTE